MSGDDVYECPIVLPEHRRGLLLIPKGLSDRDVTLILRQLENFMNNIIEIEPQENPVTNKGER